MTRKSNRKRSAGPENSSISFLVQILSFFNVFFILVGLGVLGIAIWTIVTNRSSFLVSTTYAVAAYLLIVAGCVVLLAGAVGFAGICKPSRGYLFVYVFLLLLVFVLEAAAGVLAYLYADQMKADLEKRLKGIIETDYGADASLTSAMDSLQHGIGCCGSFFYDDWLKGHWAENAEVLVKKNDLYIPVPSSCCKNVTDAFCGMISHPSNIYYDGCAEAFSHLLRTHLNIIGGVGLGVCAIQIFGAIMSCCLYSKIKPYKEVRDIDNSMRYR